MPNYSADFQIDTTPGGASRTWASMCDGFDNVAPAINETVQEYFSLCAKGYGSSDVVALHLKFTLSGVRKVGDAAQDYIAACMLKLMGGRRTSVRVTTPNADGTATRITAAATLENITPWGGASNAIGGISVTIAVNGRPVVETLAASENLTVTSAAGTASGQTVLTVVPTFPDAGCKFVYLWGDTAPAATAGAMLPPEWNDFVNGATYAIANGQKVTVAMVNVSTNTVVGSGNATVVSAT
jgi:hypothetical protein